MSRLGIESALRRNLHTRVEPLGEDRYRLALDGVLWPGWVGNLSSGLAARRLSILRGHAHGNRTGAWRASFELMRLADGDDPATLDWIAMARDEAREGFATPLRLERFDLESVLEHDGSLRLTVAAADRVGFLAALLRRLAYFSLFPVELRLETRGQRVLDELWLRSGGHRPPSSSTREALARVLNAGIED